MAWHGKAIRLKLPRFLGHTRPPPLPRRAATPSQGAGSSLGYTKTSPSAHLAHTGPYAPRLPKAAAESAMLAMAPARAQQVLGEGCQLWRGHPPPGSPP